MKYIVLVFLSFLILHESFAQKDRYRFAATYYGVEAELSLQNKQYSYLNAHGMENQKKLPSFISPRLVIGGTHFWNHADFYISIPVSNISIGGSKKVKISNNVLTGFRAYPLQLKKNSMRPFFGTGFNNMSYRQEGANGKSQLYSNWQWYYETGLSFYNQKNHLLSLELRYFPRNSFNASISRDQLKEVSLSPISLAVSYKKVIDFTRSYSTTNGQQYLQRLKDAYIEKKLFNTYSIAIGLSALIPLDHTEHASQKAFLNDEIEGNVSLDLGIGYYLHKTDMAFRLSYRPFRQKEKAYGYEYNLKKHSVAWEAFKFLGDYHGFVPFVGPYVSIDRYRLVEKDNGIAITDYSVDKLGYGIVFGWDIRLSDVEYLLLRTNLRYTPDFGYTRQGKSYTAKQLEFNFIQLVFYPERIKANRNLNK